MNPARVMGLVALTYLLWVPVAWATYWTQPIDIYPQSHADDQFARLAVPGGSAPLVLWLGADSTEGDAEIYYSRWNGFGWDPPALVNPPNSYSELSPRESEAPDGSLWVAWKAPNPEIADLYLGLVAQWIGPGWSLPDTVWRTGGRYDVPSVAAVSQDEAWIIRDGYPPGGGDSDIYTYHIQNGQVGPEYRFVQPDSDEVLPSITLSAAGTPWAVWYRINHLITRSSLMWSSHLEQGAWTTPEQIPGPSGPIAPKITSDVSGRLWVITIATDPSDPNAGYDSRTVWALAHSGSGWSTPIRLSGPLGAPDSINVQLDTTRRPGTNPRVVWIHHNLFSLTRLDMLTSAWNGAEWSAPERIGNLADSTGAMWPDVAEYGGGIWGVYMRRRSVSPFDYDVYSVYSVGEPTGTVDVDFEVEASSTGVLVRWASHISPGPLGVRLYRSATRGGEISALPSDAVSILRVGSNEVEKGEFLDDKLSPGEYDYWLEILLSPSGSTFFGPRGIRYGPGPGRAPSIISVSPSPTDRSVSISGLAARATAIDVFDVSGRRVRSMNVSEGEGRPFTIRWDGRSNEGHLAPSGVYLIRARSQDGRASQPKRVLLLR